MYSRWWKVLYLYGYLLLNNKISVLLQQFPIQSIIKIFASKCSAKIINSRNNSQLVIYCLLKTFLEHFLCALISQAIITKLNTKVRHFYLNNFINTQLYNRDWGTWFTTIVRFQYIFIPNTYLLVLGNIIILYRIG